MGGRGSGGGRSGGGGGASSQQDHEVRLRSLNYICLDEVIKLIIFVSFHHLESNYILPV